MPVVTIDGVKTTVKEGETILDAARKVGIWIPTLCFNPAFESNAACRLCMVELEREGRTQMVTACNYPVRQDIKVSVESEKAVRIRRGIMQLLLARSPDSSELKSLAERMGVKSTPYPTVTESQRNCILCGLCVNVCEEVIGSSAIGFAGRGVDRTVCPPFRLIAEECIACGACAAVCPVGTIQIRIHEDTCEAEISPFKARVSLSVCRECGTRMVSEPVAAKTLNKLNFNWEEFKQRSLLCPECRRKVTAKNLANYSGSRSGEYMLKIIKES